MTLSDKVFQALAAAIVSGRLKPGQRLDEPSVCREFGVSRTPVREALRRLGGTELVEMTPRKGVIVAELTLSNSRICMRRLRNSRVSARGSQPCG